MDTNNRKYIAYYLLFKSFDERVFAPAFMQVK